ncbi:MAG: hypothetical protein Q7T20_18235, partial [Saprospiraceae bacterium]|nr:hypothetical protein [Saprospiraceae bacterium]
YGQQNLRCAHQPSIQYFRPWDQEGINQFEPSKKADQPEYTGFKIRIGGAFTQDFQSFTNENSANYVPVGRTGATLSSQGAVIRDTVGLNRNILYGVGSVSGSGKNAKWNYNVAGDSTSSTLTGFNLAMANLNLDFQIADGIRVSLENYMSSRHHSEFWVKGGYIQIDKLPMFGLTAEPRGMLDANGNQMEVSIDRMAVAAGWFPKKNMLLKGEYVIQNYNDFLATDYRNGGKFSGFTIQAVIGF